MSHGIKNVLAVMMGVAILSLLVGGLEFGFAKLNRYFPNAWEEPASAGVVPASGARSWAVPVHLLNLKPQREVPLGRSPQQNLVDYSEDYYYSQTRNYAPVPKEGTYRVRALSAVGGPPVYDVTYEVDKNGYRVTPPLAKTPKQFTLFLGCSYAYGEGLDVAGTLPYLFEKKSPGYRSYNMAFHGYAPNDLLARAKEEDATQFVKESPGRVLYFFMADHVRRVVGSSSWVGLYGGDHPYFFLDKGELKQDRNFAQARPLAEAFSPWVIHSEIAKFFRIDFPRAFDEKHFELFGRVVGGLRDEYQRRFPGSRFYVVFFPREHLTASVAAELEKLKIHYLDYSSFVIGLYTKGPPTIEGDGHPSAEANELLADQILADLNAFESQPAAVESR